jgi:hypothetical protein
MHGIGFLNFDHAAAAAAGNSQQVLSDIGQFSCLDRLASQRGVNTGVAQERFLIFGWHLARRTGRGCRSGVSSADAGGAILFICSRVGIRQLAVRSVAMWAVEHTKNRKVGPGADGAWNPNFVSPRSLHVMAFCRNPNYK